MLTCMLPERIRWVARCFISKVKSYTLRILLYFIRQFGLKFEGAEDRLTYKWVAGPDGSFDHWFDLDGNQRAVWYISQKVGFWRLVHRLLTESEFLVGARRWEHKELRLIESENYYCSEPIFTTRDSQPRGAQIAALSDLLERYRKVGCQCREGSRELCGLCREFQTLRRDRSN